MIIAGVIAALVLIAILVANLRRQPEPAPVAPPPPPVPLAKIVAPPPPVLTRDEIVQNAASASAAYATGAKPATEKSPLIGRSFVVKIPFGCNGPGGVSSSAPARVELDPKTSTLKLVARPAIWTTLPVVQDLAQASSIETVEGFWIPRPWANSDACPPKRDTPVPATPTPPAAQTLGLARIFQKGGSRVLARGDRPYEYVVKGAKDDPTLLTRTYHLVLEGRLVGFGDGRAVHCWSESENHRPICLYAVEYDRVAFEDSESGETLVEWKS